MKLVYKFLFLMMILIILLSLFFSNLIHFDQLSEEKFINPSLDIIKLNSNLYFVGENGLESEVRTMIIKNSSIEETIIKNLVTGAKNKNYKTIFNNNFKLNDIEILDNICYVNLDINKNGYALFNDENFYLYVWSLVNTLTENDNILKVQLLFNGEKFNKKLLSYNLRNPLPRLEWIIYEENESPANIVSRFINYISIERYDLAYSLLNENSKDEIQYNEFKLISHDFAIEVTNYNEILVFTQEYKEYYNVIYKYENYKKDIIYKNWTVISEDNFFKIVLLKDNNVLVN
ncbi:MAG: GerMN domain-containing protein [Bacillota bacterium]|nr:GerMN domain-containing protein [Bacillota bacterium]